MVWCNFHGHGFVNDMKWKDEHFLLGCIYLDDKAHEAQMTYLAAYEFCAKLDAFLLELQSEQQLIFLDQILGKKILPTSIIDFITIVQCWGLEGVFRYWIGASDLFHDGQWNWIHSGEPVGSFIWGFGNPTNDVTENCAYLEAPSHIAYDISCELGAFYPLCQKIDWLGKLLYKLLYNSWRILGK